MDNQTVRIGYREFDLFGVPKEYEDVFQAPVIQAAPDKHFAFHGDTIFAVRQDRQTLEWHGDWSASATLWDNNERI